MSEFTCALCHRTFKQKRDEEWNAFKAAEEMLNLTPESKNEPTEIICDYCFHDYYLPWLDKHDLQARLKIIEDEKNGIY